MIRRPAIRNGQFVEAVQAIPFNNPSGDRTPSSQDCELTPAVKAAAATVGIRFLDHLIIGDAAPFSFKAGGLL
jgi:DNA repair protein RadC